MRLMRGVGNKSTYYRLTVFQNQNYYILNKKKNTDKETVVEQINRSIGMFCFYHVGKCLLQGEFIFRFTLKASSQLCVKREGGVLVKKFY